MHFSALSFSCSVPTFQGLQEDILSKLADVLEEVKVPFYCLFFLNLVIPGAQRLEPFPYGHYGLLQSQRSQGSFQKMNRDNGKFLLAD